jgi:hypothetical protein
MPTPLSSTLSRKQLTARLSFTVGALHLLKFRVMGRSSSTRSKGIAAFESEAEVLAAHQLDLLSQLEAQLRAVHHTMRCIEKLRGSKYRIGTELTNGERSDTLKTLASELAAIDTELNVQHQSCEDMQQSIRAMQARLSALRRTLESQTKGSRVAKGRRSARAS